MLNRPTISTIAQIVTHIFPVGLRSGSAHRQGRPRARRRRRPPPRPDPPQSMTFPGLGSRRMVQVMASKRMA